jgi:copper oxidase (laccase) domain-containing protein
MAHRWQASPQHYPVADAVFDQRSRDPSRDCPPVTSTDGTHVAAAQVRGLVAGVLEATIAALAIPPRELLVWLGPAIGPERFEVGPEVRCIHELDPAASAFRANDAPGAGGSYRLAASISIARASMRSMAGDDVRSRRPMCSFPTAATVSAAGWRR